MFENLRQKLVFVVENQLSDTNYFLLIPFLMIQFHFKISCYVWYVSHGCHKYIKYQKLVCVVENQFVFLLSDMQLLKLFMQLTQTLFIPLCLPCYFMAHITYIFIMFNVF